MVVPSHVREFADRRGRPLVKQLIQVISLHRCRCRRRGRRHAVGILLERVLSDEMRRLGRWVAAIMVLQRNPWWIVEPNIIELWSEVAEVLGCPKEKVSELVDIFLLNILLLRRKELDIALQISVVVLRSKLVVVHGRLPGLQGSHVLLLYLIIILAPLLADVCRMARAVLRILLLSQQIEVRWELHLICGSLFLSLGGNQLLPLK